jgi:thiamine biosynthesis lipoprotein
MSGLTRDAPFNLQFEAIGTVWSVEVYQPVSAARAAALEQAVHRRIDAFDLHYSRFRADSLVSRMSRHAGTYELPSDAQPLFDLYHELYRHTGGAVTPLIGQTLSDAGYDATYSLKPRPLTPPPAWDEVLDYHYPRLTLHRPALLDVGAAGKGYLVDLVAGLLEDAGLSAYCVDAGGDLRYRRPGPQSTRVGPQSHPGSNPAAPPLRIGLEHPADPTQAIGVAELPGSGLSLCGSAGNRRAWAGYHHVLDPRTLASPRHLAAVWVTAGTTLLADALTTALFFVAPAELNRYYKFNYALVYADYSLDHSPGFPAQFFTT